MTPVQMQVMLHYYYGVDDYNNGNFDTPAVRGAVDFLEKAEMLTHAETQTATAEFTITERGRVYVEALKAVPLPVRQWVMPS